VPRKRKPVYNGAFIRPGQQQALPIWLLMQEKKRFQNHPATTSGRWYCHHMTHAFKPKGEDLDLPYGEEVELRVAGITFSDRCIALLVESPFSRDLEHITMWCADGVPPKYSNQQIDEQGYEPWETDVSVTARVGWFNGKEVLYSAPEI